MGYEGWKKGIGRYYGNGGKVMGRVKVGKVKGRVEWEVKRMEGRRVVILDEVLVVKVDGKEGGMVVDIIEEGDGGKWMMMRWEVGRENWYDGMGEGRVGDGIMDGIIDRGEGIEVRGESVGKMGG